MCGTTTTWERARDDKNSVYGQNGNFNCSLGHSGEDTMTKADATYAKFEALEEQVAHCYFLLNERFVTNPPLGKFWAEAALDELQHSSILRYCREHRLFAEALVDAGTAARIDELLDTVKSIVEDPNVTVDDAFYASLLIESSELDDSYEKLTRPLANDHPLLYHAIQATLRMHHDKFADGAAEFTSDRAYVEAFRSIGQAEKRAAS